MILHKTFIKLASIAMHTKITYESKQNYLDYTIYGDSIVTGKDTPALQILNQNRSLLNLVPNIKFSESAGKLKQ